MAPAKSKTQKMSLGDFLGDQSLGSWADEMEDMPVASESRTGYGGERRAFSSTTSYGGDRFGDRGGDRSGYATREQLPLPTKPPFTAHLGNLSFDATEGDVNDFFSGCNVTNVRIVEDKMDRKPKGFGYVEFATLDGLKRALELGGSQFQGRNIRISVADPPKDRPEARELNDWTRKGPLPDIPNQRRASEWGSGRNFDSHSDAGHDRERRRPPPFEGDGKTRDFGTWERKGPLSPVPSSGPVRDGGRVRSNEGPRERRISPAWGEGRSQDGSRPPRREFQEKQFTERQPSAAELDNQWRAKMKPDAPAKSPLATPDTSTPSSPAASAAVPAVRPKLNLAKRTVSEAEPAPVASGDSKSSPFGGARPIDTTAREREVAEKRELALRLKKEQDEKAREEKRAKEAASRAEKSATSPKENGKTPTQESAKENGTVSPTSGSNYEILRRVDNEEPSEPGDEAEETPASGTAVGEAMVSPKEAVTETPNQAGTSWRQNASTPAGSAGSSSEKAEEDGWSTVPAKQKNNRRGGNNNTRVVAS